MANALPTARQSRKDVEKENSLKLIIDEQRRDYDYLLSIYDRTRATENILLTAGFGVLAYLYYAAPQGSRLSIVERLFMPHEDYGKVIYVIAASFFAYGILKLIFTVFGDNPWETAYETSKASYSHQQIDTLEYIKDRYDICHRLNGKAYYDRKKQLIFLFYTILLSAIILVVIKTLR